MVHSSAILFCRPFQSRNPAGPADPGPNAFQSLCGRNSTRKAEILSAAQKNARKDRVPERLPGDAPPPSAGASFKGVRECSPARPPQERLSRGSGDAPPPALRRSAFKGVRGTLPRSPSAGASFKGVRGTLPRSPSAGASFKGVRGTLSRGKRPPAGSPLSSPSPAGRGPGGGATGPCDPLLTKPDTRI